MQIWDELQDVQRNLRQTLFRDEDSWPLFDQERIEERKNDMYTTGRPEEGFRPQRDKVENALGATRGALNDMLVMDRLRRHEDVDWSAWRPDDLQGNLFKLHRKRNVPGEIQDIVDEHDCVMHEVEERDQWRRVRCPRDIEEKVKR